MRTSIIIWIMAGISGLLAGSGGNVNEFSDKLPKKFNDWEARNADAVYDRETLYEYMDGGAEVYLAFSFQMVFSRRYNSPDTREITLDIYDMGTPAEAFGIFSCDRSDPDAGVGQESEYGYGLLRFWQGRYFVTLSASADDPATGKVMIELGRSLLPHLGPGGDRPDLVEALPKEDLNDRRTSYFHSNINLNNRFFIAAENILQLNEKTTCVVAEYESPGGKPVTLLAVRYPDPASATTAHDSFRSGFLPEAGTGGRARTEDGRWVSVQKREEMLTILFDVPQPEWATRFEAKLPFLQK